MKGLICAGGTATRLEELTRVTNKHLLPVGRWPMVYYPLQLLQRVGVREVLLVTGKQHAGDFIDLLGDGHVRRARRRRAALRPRPDLQGAGRAGRDRAGRRDGARLRRRRQARGLPRRQHLRVRAGRRDRGRGTTARSCSSRRWPTPRASASSPTTRTASVDRHRREGRRRRHALRRAALERRGRRAVLLSARRVRDHRRPRSRRAAASSRSPTSTASTRGAASSTCGASRAGGTTAASTGAISPKSAGGSRRPASTSDRRVVAFRCAASRTSAAGSRARARERAAEADRGRRTSLGRARV